MELSQKYLSLVAKVKESINEISIDEILSLLQNKKAFVLIDIREESEWAEKRIPKAIYLGKGIVEREIENVIHDESMKIVLYCGGGYRSALSAENLQRMGYTDVYSMIGGITEWEERGLPTNK